MTTQEKEKEIIDKICSARYLRWRYCDFNYTTEFRGLTIILSTACGQPPLLTIDGLNIGGERLIELRAELNNSFARKRAGSIGERVDEIYENLIGGGAQMD